MANRCASSTSPARHAWTSTAGRSPTSISSPGGLCVNREIIARGFGHAYTRYPFTFLDDFRAAERSAREGQVGLWGTDPRRPNPRRRRLVFITRTGLEVPPGRLPVSHRGRDENCRSLAASARLSALLGLQPTAPAQSLRRPSGRPSANHFDPRLVGFSGAGGSSSFSRTPATCPWSLMAVAMVKSGPASSSSRSRPAS